MDYSPYDLLDEFTIGQIFIAYTLKEDGSCDGTKSGIVRDALIKAIINDELISTVHTDKILREKYLSNNMPQSAIEWNLSEVRIQRDELKKWFESKGQQPAFLFKEARSSDEQQDPDSLVNDSAQLENASPLSTPGHLHVVVDDVIEQVIVDGSGKQKTYNRSAIVGRGTATWDLLVAFAKCRGSLEGNAASEVKKINTSANRNNLSDKLVVGMNLDEPPIVKGRHGIMRFRSIRLASDASSTDAMDRKIYSIDDQATEYLRNHGDDFPDID